MQCVGYGVGVPGPEPDGLCHKRSGGDVYPLIGDVFLGGENGLLAFLAVGMLRVPNQPFVKPIVIC